MRSSSYLLKSRYFVPYDLTALQQSFLMPYFGLKSIADPKRGDYVAGLGDSSGQYSLIRIRNILVKSTNGRKLLEMKPLISSSTLPMEQLRNLKIETLGGSYIKFMDDHNFSADERSIVRFITDPELAFIMARYRQVHDFWHVLSGLPPSILGEIALKWFEYSVTGLPVCFFSGILGPLKLSQCERQILLKEYLPWVMRSKVSIEDLLCYDYEGNLGRDLNSVRLELNFEAAPCVERLLKK